MQCPATALARQVASSSRRYGLGFWIRRGVPNMEGADAGVSFSSVHDRETMVTGTVISNTSDGAWPIARYLREALN